MEGVFGHGPAEDAQARPVVGCHLDLVLRPDDQLCHQAVVDLWAGDVALLVFSWQAGQAVPAAERGETAGTRHQVYPHSLRTWRETK